LLFKSLVADRGARLSGRRSATGNGARPSLTFERATVTPAKSPAGAEGSGEPDAEGCSMGTRWRARRETLEIHGLGGDIRTRVLRHAQDRSSVDLSLVSAASASAPRGAAAVRTVRDRYQRDLDQERGRRAAPVLCPCPFAPAPAAEANGARGGAKGRVSIPRAKPRGIGTREPKGINFRGFPGPAARAAKVSNRRARARSRASRTGRRGATSAREGGTGMRLELDFRGDGPSRNRLRKKMFRTGVA